MINNVYIEGNAAQQLEWLKDESPADVFKKFLDSIDKYLNNEIRKAVYDGNDRQSHLAFLGIHAAVLTIAEAIWGRDEKKTKLYKRFVVRFMDTDVDKFSSVADTIHDWRNNLAHQWLGSIGYAIRYDYNMKKGFSKDDGVITINPRKYYDAYQNCFTNSCILQYFDTLTAAEQDAVKRNIIDKFENNRRTICKSNIKTSLVIIGVTLGVMAGFIVLTALVKMVLVDVLHWF